MSAEPDRPRVAPESGRPAASDDTVTRKATVTPDEMSGDNARPDEELFEDLREMGWTGTPFVTHAGEVLGNTEMYEAAERLGIADRVPRVGIDDVFREAGFDMDRYAEGTDPTEDPGRAYFEDYMRELPRHLRDKYGI